MTDPTRISNRVVLDDTSKAIIRLLQQDGRAPYAMLAREVGLSEAAVRQRVQRLLESELLQIVAVTDPVQVGFERQALIGVSTTGDSEHIAHALSEIEAVSYVVTTAGRYDLLVEVVCEDDDQLLELLQRRIRTVDGVVGTETFTYLRLNKQRYDWGTR
ncbi:Lrp/AsnC family transcriptional regulator [Luteipulveratus halotolerans]|uniref:Lrp/AsnC family transcriptional regulator n=1 Tax=Luteipulveratus halotolerans TaxID=1631356 RepID=UPI00067FBEE1|nr:Lrp/AsnC family transcriptional regulator [Luteipulveratus halotolerans]